MLLTRAGRLPLSSFLCFIGGFSMGSWLTLFHQLQVEKEFDGAGPISKWNAEDQQHLPQADLSKILLIVLIISSPENFRKRSVIRDTWLKLESSESVKHLFVVGEENLSASLAYSIVEEGTHHSDMLLLPIVDSYSNLTLKVSASIAAVAKYRPSSYVLKLDDDSFARIDLIVSELRQQFSNSAIRHSPRKCFYWGFFDGRARPKKSGKWKETEYNLCDNYIPYALGGGYVLSEECVLFVAKNQKILRKFQNEDISMGTWLSGIEVYRRHDRRFDTEFESRGCNNEYLVQHKISEADMKERYENLVNNKKLCTSEYRRRASFEYDWTVPPSQCCKRNSSLF